MKNLKKTAVTKEKKETLINIKKICGEELQKVYIPEYSYDVYAVTKNGDLYCIPEWAIENVK